ncbi:putative ATP-dependent RNA helicase DDX11-like protein 8 isoform X2 [Daktulosphaira vitifoliae]|uniref:putative ATP-dependent RNA helicase DDX11-like protein 8 isoform X2 n=1 Tax=Daktulosphaira vitifoliae TaxID=58002 RepID=UPI0021AAB31E|nr:putative ATP-dependent RNA helicase DDX11-like protein 8 isoform X2 [Daktulosphaira vitifoliae]
MAKLVYFKDIIIEEKLDPPSDFSFPFKPYKIQHDFMTNLYKAIENKKLGIFESPTGTGKTLSIICGAVRWLFDNEQRELRQLRSTLLSLEKKKEDSGENDDDEDDDWITGQAKLAEKNQKIYEISLVLKSLEEYNNNIEELKEIYFCSRTHSQLSQFITEMKKSPYGSTRVVSLASRQNYCINKTVKKLNNITLMNERCLEMGKSKISQKSTKISPNGPVLKKKKSEAICKCPYNDKEKIKSLAEEVVIEIRDMEQLVNRGEELTVCPYYASRESVKYSQIIVLPYNTLFHKSTREASGIKLEGNIFIIDEAHNLLDTIGHIHSSQINGQQLTHSYSQLIQYKDKYELRFSASNLLNLNQLIYVIGKLIIMLGGTPGISHVEASRKGVDSKVYSLEDFVHQAEIDHLNMFVLVDFFKKSKIGQKIRGFSEKYMPSVNLQEKKPKLSNLQAFLKDIESKKNNKGKPKEDENEQNESKPLELISNNPLTPVMTFIESLTNHCEDGRIVCSRQAFVGKGSLKFLLLNPAVHFKEIVEKARSVIVSGGTMEPISEFKDQLFNFKNDDCDRILQFNCGHVVPSDHILPLIVCSGPSGKLLDFSYQERSSAKILNEIGSVLENVCRTVPAGIVCFFPSYDYEKLVYQHLEKNKIINRISEKKKVFREPKSTNQVDDVLKNYSLSIKKAMSSSDSKLTGALLFSVIGGKLSEGLNFSDDLGRCVIVVGLPYPNIKSAELQEKMNYLDTHMSKGSGQQYYENLCMKAVNQSIGRSVRHQQDYAAVLLLDHRYKKENVCNALPKWLQSSLQIHTTFGAAFSQLNKFFAEKKKVKERKT